ncbi:MAG: hypothetical protein U9N04_04405 [Patescibacteria group bacterium]|nr:hypothetical protein [Patescibacteria group bacterium]
MKKHSSRKCSKGKTGYRTPSVFRDAVDEKNKKSKIRINKKK